MPRPLAVLIVDGFGDEAEMYAEYLVRAGCRVTVCDDASTVLAVARTMHPDVVVVRRRTPDGAVVGTDLTLDLRRQRATSRTPIVVLSSTIGADAEEAARLAGADDYILIPCLPQHLASRLATVVARARMKRVSIPVATARRRRSA